MKRLVIALLLMFVGVRSDAALLTGIMWEVEEGSSNSNGGGFSPAVTGFPTDGQATSATGSAPVFSSASYNFVSGDVGAWLFIKSGTNWNPGWYKIASVASNDATLTASVGAGVTYSAYQLTAVAGVAITGSPTGATWGIDYSQQASPQFAYTDMVTVTTTYTSVGHPVAVNVIGNVVQVVSGSGSCAAGLYTVVSTSTTTATIDRTAGTGTCTSNLGGAFGTHAQLNTAMNVTNGIAQIGWVKANSTYSISSGITFNATDNGKGTAIQVNGYSSVHSDGGMSTIQASSGSITMVTISNNNNLANFVFRNHIINCNSQTTTGGFSISANGNMGENLHVENCTANGINLGNAIPLLCRNCWVSGQTGAVSFYVESGSASQNMECIWCFATGGTVPGFVITSSFTCIWCIVANNTGSTTDGIQVNPSSGGIVVFANSIFYKNGRDGVRWTPDSPAGNTQFTLVNSVMYGNSAYGLDNTGTTGIPSAYAPYENYNAYGGNTTAPVNNVIQGLNDVALSADPFTNGASLNFAPNTTSGGGPALTGAGFPGVLLSGGTGYIDIGTLQHVNAAPAALAIGFVQ